MKKVCLFLALLLTATNICVFAAETPKISVSSAQASAGETVDVTVSLENNPGIISMLLDVTYDDTVMTLVDVKDAGIFGAPLHSDSLSAKPYALFWSNGTAESDYKINGTVATLKFEISKNAKAGEYPVNVSYDKDDDGIFNFDLDAVDFAVSNGIISVKAAANSGNTPEDKKPEQGGNAVEDKKPEQGGNAVEDKKPEQSGNAADDKKPENPAPPVETKDKDDQKDNEVKAPNEISVKINGEDLVFPDQKPVIVDDRTLVPLRAIFEALGATVDWDDDTKTVTAVREDIEISLTINSDQLFVNGDAKTIDVPAQIINDRTMVPIRAIAESFECNVGWEQDTKTVIITF